MIQFVYTVTNPVGIHARPAGLLVQTAKGLNSAVTVTRADGASAPASRLLALMALGVKQGDTVTVCVEGGDEEANAAALEQFFRSSL